MGLGNRDARRHQTAKTAGIDPAAYWDFQPGETVMTVDGFLGKVEAVYDGPVAGNEEYQVVLANGLGGGTYTAGQLSAATSATASHENTAAKDYPELAEVLTERLDPGKYPNSTMGLTASLHQAEYYTADELREIGRAEEARLGMSSEDILAKQAEVGGKPSLCENGHLTWGGDCASCRGADTGQNAMVVNEGDHKPQDVGKTGSRVMLAAWSPGGQEECDECSSIMHTTDEHDLFETHGQGGNLESEKADDLRHDHIPQIPAPPGDGFLVSHCEDHGTKATGDLRSQHYYLDAAHDCHNVAHDPGGQHAQDHRSDGSDCWSCCPNMRVAHPGELESGQNYTAKKQGAWSPSGHAECDECASLFHSTDEHDLFHQHGQGGNLRSEDEECGVCGSGEHGTDEHEDDREPEPYCDKCGHEGHSESEHEVSCALCGNMKDPDTDEHPYNGEGPNKVCPNGTEGLNHRIDERARYLDATSSDKYCNKNCMNSHALDMEIGLNTDLHGDVTKADSQHVCRNCGTPLAGSVGDQIKDIGTPGEHAFLKTNPTGPTKYSALEYGWKMLCAAKDDQSLAFHITAAWRDVRSKAKRIRTEGGVHITTAQNGYYIATVKGDHGTYESVLMRAPGTQKIAQWDCGCKWAQYHWGAPDDYSRFAGRMCSHALALTYEAQSRGMFGREIKPNQGVPRWLNHGEGPLTSMERGFGHGTRLDVPSGPSVPNTPALDRAAAHDPSFLQVFAALAVEAGETPANVAELLAVVGAVSSPFGEPAPHPVPGIGPNGATEPRRQENPASAGFLTASDPDGWGQQTPLEMGDRVAAKEIPGLGCPHCSDGFYTMDERTNHIRDEHPGEYSGPDQEMSDLFEMRPELKRQSGLDEALFEPEITKEANPALLVPLMRAVAPAIKQVAPKVLDKAKDVAPKVLKEMAPSLAPKILGEDDPRETDKKGRPQRTEGEQWARALNRWTDQSAEEGEAAKSDQAWMMNIATLHDEPEAALPETYGVEDDDTTWSGYAGDPDPDPKQAAISTDVEYAVPSDPGSSGGSAAPSTNFKTDPTSLEPEDPSFVTTGSVQDIVEEFQRTAGAQALGSPAGQASDDAREIAEAARQHLSKEGMANFTLAQQQELIDEGKDVRASNLDRLEITGTHYEALQALQPDEDEDDEGWLS